MTMIGTAERTFVASEKRPLGLQNLGNTCYMNSSLQAIRTIPELDVALQEFKSSASSGEETLDAALTESLKNLFETMRNPTVTQECAVPLEVITALRQVAPQFQEKDQRGEYAMQDADETWTQTISSLHETLRPDSTAMSCVDQYLGVKLQQTLSCNEAPEEPPAIKFESASKLECNITIDTNHLLTGIKNVHSLNQIFKNQHQKNSPSLGRVAIYTQTSRLSRLPTNLAIHLVRLYWRADIQKKVKITRRVEFPLQLNVFDLLSEELKPIVAPIRVAVRDIQKGREARAKIRRSRTHGSVRVPAVLRQRSGDLESKTVTLMEADKLEDEVTLHRREEEKLRVLVRRTVGEREEQGPSWSGLYEMSGHYFAWTRQESSDDVIPGEEEWYKFNDEKVSMVGKDKIQALAGGGEDSVAYMLLYRAAM
ncbi:hypothetical protein QFC20_005154 [Naganishia adeliensis]|uniref:Uncharacterized protein n=1 Tax=Naganishia adeliensis TaxID=92952 RepID=A0ACC2VRX3_9TREE|nr:hypothetical protein QFC20_005154 [Naganishia adeliensis]